jgi:predicted ArsR family transcriptional regulator
VTGAAVRRHLDGLLEEGLIEKVEPARRGVGRPPRAWRLSPAGMETFPRRYDALAVEVLDDLAAHDPAAIEAVFERRTAALAAEYRSAMNGLDDLASRVAALARLRDDAGYVAASESGDDGTSVLTEHNCAIHRVASRHPVVCASELALLREVLGPEVEVDRVAHAVAGDACCSYQVRWRCGSGQDEPPSQDGSEQPQP